MTHRDTKEIPHECPRSDPATAVFEIIIQSEQAHKLLRCDSNILSSATHLRPTFFVRQSQSFLLRTLSLRFSNVVASPNKALITVCGLCILAYPAPQ